MKIFWKKWSALGVVMVACQAAGAQQTSATTAGLSQTQKSFLPGELWPDDNGVPINAHGGGILLHEGTYYWFGEHKIEGKAGNKAQVGVHAYSSTDLYNWKDEGISLSVSEDPKSEIAKGCVLERPKVIYNAKTGQFVMWFHLEPPGKGYGAARSGVAVADKVTGPYRYLGSFRPNAGVWPENFPLEKRKPLTTEEETHLQQVLKDGTKKKEPQFADLIVRRDFAGGQMARDMTLFVDDNQKAYQIYASEDNSTIEISELSEDYLKPAGHYIRIFPNDYNEAPALFKHDGTYFLITSGQHSWTPCDARLATADSVMGTWTALGTPVRGSKQQVDRTFESQSTYVLPIPGNKDAFIFMADRWQPTNAIDGRYVWLPIQFEDEKPILKWLPQWDLSFFDSKSNISRQ